jgi:hypothetical protein
LRWSPSVSAVSDEDPVVVLLAFSLSVVVVAVAPHRDGRESETEGTE